MHSIKINVDEIKHSNQQASDIDELENLVTLQNNSKITEENFDRVSTPEKWSKYIIRQFS
jgi:hypothetical protein